MGIYINALGQPKEAWLDSNAIPTGGPPASLSEVPDDCVLVCLIDNGWMTAAGVAYSERELNDMQDPGDRRPKSWFLVEKDKLAGVVTAEDLAFLHRNT